MAAQNPRPGLIEAREATEMNIPTMSPSLKTSLVKRGITMFSLAPLVLAAWAIGADHFGWDVVDSARYSAICLMFILAAFILSPLLMPRNKEERRLGFIFYWFTVSTLFNLSWQIPLILFRSTITQAEITHANLYKYIAWWGYGFAYCFSTASLGCINNDR
jgi:hypothetical protein